jgi:ABC-type uncharacterized transport system involved in gliding motility auxiliary subunit
MKQKKVETLLYSVTGVAVMFIIIVAVNFIGSAFKARFDMTEERLYSLSPGTRAILKKLDSPVEVRFYYTQRENQIPPALRNYARHVEDLLDEVRQNSGGNIEVKKYDPEPDSESEDLANLDGVEGQMMQTGEKFYLGLAISLDPAKVSIPFLSPEREKLLEYDLARAISQVMSTNKPVLGVMTPLPMFGQPMNPMMARMGQQQGQEPWVVISELKKDFEVKQIAMDVEKIDDDVRVLLVVHPKEIKEGAQYAIDQFIMRGGKLVAMLDPMCLMDQNRQNPMMPMPGGPSNLDKLLKAWGLTFETTKVAADMNYARRLQTRGNQAEIVPPFLFLADQAINKDDVVCQQVDEVLLPFAGVFTGTPVAGLKETILLKTSKNAQLVEGFMAQMAPGKVAEDFKSADTSYALAVRLEGKFKSAFPDGKPAAKPEDDKDKDGDKDKEKDKKPAASGDSLKEGKADNAVVLIGDTDWIYDHYSVQVQTIPMLNYRIVQPRNGNLALAQNIIEQQGGDSNLIGVRSRGTLQRPFKVVQEMQAKANARFQTEIANLQKEADEANQKLSQLAGQKEAGQRFVLSKEQQDEIEKFKKKRADANKKLKVTRRDLQRDINSLENTLKWSNILGMPFIVVAVGIALASVRKQKTKAK